MGGDERHGMERVGEGVRGSVRRGKGRVGEGRDLKRGVWGVGRRERLKERKRG